MSILIKGMEMPKSCSECFVKFCDQRVTVKHFAVERGENCPLIPVPPHGRLIDADALMDEAYQPGAYGYVDAIQIDKAPTIIPASKEGE